MADQEYSLKDLTPVVPIVASSFAFSFVVGYFSAFDISWFTFFTLSEHVTFALRALPIAIAASVGFLIGLTFSQLQSQWKWLGKLRLWLVFLWVFLLVAASAYAGWLEHHFGLAVSFLIIAGGALYHHRVPAPYMSFASILYWATTLIVLSFIAGFSSASAWKVAGLAPSSKTLILGSESARSKKIVGRVIFSGHAGVLFYEFKSGTGARLLLWKDIKEIVECTQNATSGDCAEPPPIASGVTPALRP